MALNFKKLKDFGHLVMFSHSIFSLPFGLIAMIFATGGIPELGIFIWILIALLGARNGANAFNRIADKDIDKKNTRTSERDIPAGRIKVAEAYALTIFCFLIMGIAAYQLNLLCLILMPFAIFIFVLYSYSKRFTWLCHYILGVACGGAPVGAWIAVTGSISLLPLIMGASVCFWIAGFDIIYATQDIEFDRAEKLYSVPAKFGFENALLIAKASHVISLLFLTTLPYFVNSEENRLGIIYYIGILLIGILLVVEHYNVNPKNIKKMKLVSYSINQLISIIYFIFTLTDYFLA